MKTKILYQYLLVLAALLLAPAAVYPADIKDPSGGYETQVRASFRGGKWKEGKKILDKGIRKYPDASELNELMGQYYLHFQQYDRSRFYLIKATQGKKDNLHAKQLLIDLEDATGNYSSAINYINEILESMPYDKTLWTRMIKLYRKDGNHKLADHFLERLTRIYPNDQKLRSQFTARTEEKADAARKSGDIQDAISQLETLVNNNNSNVDYYLSLSNLYLQVGKRADALSVVERGLLHTGGHIALVRRKVGILTEEHRYGEAIGFLKEFQKKHPGAAVATLLKNVQEESAYESLQNDPYIQMARLYERNHSREALQFLLNTSFTREYNEDALFYIAQMKKTSGTTPQLLYKEYLVRRRMGYDKKAFSILEQLHRLQPRNMDVVAELTSYHLSAADKYMLARQFDEAIPPLNWIIDNDTVSEHIQAPATKSLSVSVNWVVIRMPWRWSTG